MHKEKKNRNEKNFSIEARKTQNKFTLYMHIQQLPQPSSSDQDPLYKGGTSTQEASIYIRKGSSSLKKTHTRQERYKYAMLGW